ncbi:MAG: hypothetical protein KDD32_07865, partial [Bacteroidetes bacterium]|nr:hypothetical protein [Bacteroidota bacterium]
MRATRPITKLHWQIFIIALLSITHIPLYGQTIVEKIDNIKQIDQSVVIHSVEVINETFYHAFDGAINIFVSDDNTQRSLYTVIYELHEKDNFQVIEGLSSVDGKITIVNANNGDYLGFQVIRETDLKASSRYSCSLKLKSSDPIFNESNYRTYCSKSFTDCKGNSRSFSNLEVGYYYTANESYRPCGFYLDNNCNISENAQWHCIDGDLSTPGQFSQYSFESVGYLEIGITALMAARINWIICNYSYNASNVASAIWYITGTGGSNNSIAQAATAAITSPDGSENFMTFYKSSSSWLQKMVKWECQTGCNLNVNAGIDESICSGESTTLTATATNGTPPLTYTWDNGLGTGQTKTVSPTITTTYTVTVVDGDDCVASDQITVTVNNGVEDGGTIESDEEKCGPYDPELIENVTEATSTNCPLVVESCCGSGDKPTQFLLLYNGESCAESNNHQGNIGGKWDCNGDALGDPSVYISVNDNQFSGTVNLNGTFIVSNGGSRLRNPIEITIYDQQGGNELQYIEIHTSCSSPIVTGDQFGSIVLLSAEFENNFECGVSSGVAYQWEKREGTSGNWNAISGATGISYDPSFITVTTQYRRKATDCCGSNYSNIVTKTVHAKPTVTTSDDVVKCSEEEGVDITATATGGTPDYTFT